MWKITLFKIALLIELVIIITCVHYSKESNHENKDEYPLINSIANPNKLR